MSKRDRRPPTEGSGPSVRVWLPALGFLSVPVYEILRATEESNYVNQALIVHHQTLNTLSFLCFGGAACLAFFPFLRRWAVEHLEGLDHGPGKLGWLWAGLGFLGIFLLLGFIKFCQYRGFQLPSDTAVLTNMAYNFLHHGSLGSVMESSPNFLGVHIHMLVYVFSPVLLIWNGSLPLAMLQIFFLASSALAAYYLAYDRTRSSLAGFLAMLVAFSCPLLYEIGSSSLTYGSLPAFFLWMVLAAERRHWAACACFLVLSLLTLENVPVTLFGLGIYLLVKAWMGRPSQTVVAGDLAPESGLRRVPLWAWGLAVCVLSAGVQLLEIRLMGSFGQQSKPQWVFEEYSRRYGGPADPLGLAAHFATHPWAWLSKILWPPSNLGPLWKILLSCGAVCLFAPAELTVFAISHLPAFLMVPGEHMHDMKLQYASYVFGPFLWASVCGLSWLYRKFSPGKFQAWLLLWVLIGAGWGFRSAHRTLLFEWMPHWFHALPGVIRKVPPGASLWADEFMTAWVAARSQLKTLNAPRTFKSMLFRPEYVLFTQDWVHFARNDFGNSLLTYLAEEGYQVAHFDPGSRAILMKDPAAPHPGLSPEIAFPQPDLKKAETLRGQLLGAGPAGDTPIKHLRRRGSPWKT